MMDLSLDSGTLDLALRARATEQLDAIVAAAFAELGRSSPTPDHAQSALRIGMSGSDAAAAVLLGYHAIHTGVRPPVDEIGEYLNRALSTSLVFPPTLGMFSGVVGSGWAVAHVLRLCHTATDVISDTLQELDEFLLEVLQPRNTSLPFDLVSGVVGAGTYGLERIDHPTGRRIVEDAVSWLEKNSLMHRGHRQWVQAVPTTFQPLRRNRTHRLGVAHGAAGVAGFLTSVVEANVSETGARELLADAVAGIVRIIGVEPAEPATQRDETQERAILRERELDSLAWCWGDPGIGCILMRAGRVLADEAVTECGRGLLCDVISNTFCDEASLCHGSAGLAHMFRRAWMWSGESEFEREADRLIAVTVESADRGDNSGHHVFHLERADGQLEWQRSDGFLSGSRGVALALLAALDSRCSGWDRSLLLS